METITDKPTEYAIVVPKVTPDRICFLITPFNDEFDPTLNAISAAVSAAGDGGSAPNAVSAPKLTPVSLKTSYDKPSFIDEIFKHIRNARLVIAVCLRDGPGDSFSANVMYELGLAHALGKPTIVLARQETEAERRDPVPSDLRARPYIPYTQAEVSTHAFRMRLKGEIEGRLLRLDKHHMLVDPNIDSVKESHHWPVVSTTALDSFVTVLSFAQTIHKALTDFSRGLLATKQQFDRIGRNDEPELEGRETLVQQSGMLLLVYTSGLKREGLETVDEKTGAIRECFRRLESDTGAVWKQMEQAKLSCDKLVAGLVPLKVDASSLAQRLSDIETIIDSAVAGGEPLPAVVKREARVLGGLVLKLSATANKLTTFAQEMLQNLIPTLRREDANG